MPDTGATRLGQLLVRGGLIAEADLGHDQAAEATTAVGLARALIEAGAMTEERFTTFLSTYCRVPYASILDEIVKSNAKNTLPAEVCLDLRLLPVSITEEDLTVAMVNPTDAAALHKVRDLCPNRTIRAIACDPNQFVSVAKKFFATEASVKDKLAALESHSAETAETFMADVLNNVEEAQRVEFVEQAAMNALAAMADRIRVFQGVPPLDVASLLTVGMIEEYDAGRSIFQKGSGGGELYVLLSGRVSIKDGDNVLAQMEPGDVFGELAYLANTARTASAIAEEQSAVLSLSEDDFQTLIEGKWGSRILLNLFGLMTDRLARMNERLRQLESR